MFTTSFREREEDLKWGRGRQRESSGQRSDGIRGRVGGA